MAELYKQRSSLGLSRLAEKRPCKGVIFVHLRKTLWQRLPRLKDLVVPLNRNLLMINSKHSYNP